MKKNFYYIMTLLLSLSSLYSCKDEVMLESEYGSVDREFMTMFRKDANTGKGDSDPYKCQAVNVNDIQLYWYGVKDCAGYELKMALASNVRSGLASDWENPDYIMFDTIVGPDVLDLLITDLQYNTDHYFAIRTLSKKGEGYHSNWYGYGGTSESSEYMNITTGARYNVPEVIVGSDITKNSFRINIDPEVASAGSDDTFLENFEINDGKFVMQKLRVVPSPTNPDAQIDSKWSDYTLTDEDFERGYVEITGLQENSVYVADVLNENVPVYWDAIYNTCVIRTDGTPGEPIFIEHYCDPNDTIPGATQYNACRLDTILTNYITDTSLAEGTIFELEAGKTYYFASSVSLVKGLTLRTREDGSGKKARVLFNGMSESNGSPVTNNFILGRAAQTGELGAINIKDLIFENIEFDCPLARHYQNNSGGTGNYFMNMLSNGMSVSIQSIQMINCDFQRMIRGFVRVQGNNRKTFEKFVIDGCLFYNCGYYDNNGRGYSWIAGDGKHVKSNIFKNMIIRNNTFYDSPRHAFFNDGGKAFDWGSDIQFNITVENNTFLNYSTRTSSRRIFDLKYIPGGSTITVRKNLFILTKNEADVNRKLYLDGMYIDQILGSGVATFNIEDNYSTNTNLTGGQIFSGSSFAATKSSAGKWPDYCVNGKDELQVKLGNDGGLSPTELMVNPNPPFFEGVDIPVHGTANLFGETPNNENKSLTKAVNLYYNNTDKVRNSEIYKKGIGDQRWAKFVTP